MSDNEIKRSISSSSSFTKIINSWGHQSGLALKNVAGSYISYISYCIIQKKNGNHLFILPEKEQALYFFNDLENLFSNERGITLLFYPASYRRPYQIMDADPTSILQRTEAIDSLDKKYKSEIGEDGIKLSGGQRQRIGIARAMYKNSNFLILDEATSALDTKTEKALMKNIDQLSEDITIILVSHRLSSLKNCDKIITIENGEIISLGIPEEYKN